MIGRQKRDWNHSASQNKLVQDSEGNEENGQPDSDSNKTKINYTKEANKAQKNNLKEEILQVINENYIEMIVDMVNQMHRRHSRNSNTRKIKNKRKHKNK
jgi:predicted house-cleaning noncanonical NTP pyrophosphatase (MazG superfamily)